MTPPLLSILIPSVPSRLANQAAALFSKLTAQAEGLPVEVLLLADNKRRRVGLKRQALLEAARGEYVAFCDDDDDVSDDYISALIQGCDRGMDVVTFRQLAVIEGVEGTIHFSATHKTDEPWRAGQTAKRRPWHVCAWRRGLALCGIFTDKNFGEDLDWLNQVAPLVKCETHIARVLHTYRHSTGTTEAPPPV